MVPVITLHQFGTMIGFVLILSICCALESYHQDSISSWEDSQFVGYNVECILYLQEDDDLQQQKGNLVVEMVDLEYWVCGDMDSVNDDDARFSSVSFAEIDSKYFDLQEYLYSNGATSGSSKLVLSEAVVTPKTATLFVPKYATIKIEDVIAVRERSLAPKSGVLSTLLVRLIDSNDKAPGISSRDLYQRTFSSPDGRSLAEIMAGCSYGKLRIVPEKSNEDIKLAIDLKVDLAIEPGLSRIVFANKAEEILKKSYVNYDQIDLIHFCMPGGTSRPDGTSWTAYAQTGGRISAYNDEGNWCHSVSTKMHEVGHNVGLQHSPGDLTDLMYTGFDETTTGFQRMCYNSAKNFELDWYANMQLEIDSLSDFDFVKPSFSKNYTMIGIDNYTKSGSVSDGLVVLRLGDYFVGYNTKKGINDGVKQDGNRIIIVKRNTSNGESNKKVALGFRQKYTIQDFDQERSITIKFSDVNVLQGIATIQIFDDENAPVNDDDDNLKGPCDPLIYFELTVEIVGDNYPEDISWVIDNYNTKERLFEEKDYTVEWKDNGGDPAPDVRTFCLAYATEFEFVISDTNGDGISGRNYGEGYYKGYGPGGFKTFLGGKLDPIGNPNYESTDTRLFMTPSPPPTLAPTKSPTAVPTTKPTAAPTTAAPTPVPTTDPTDLPTNIPTKTPTNAPTDAPTTNTPTNVPTDAPTNALTDTLTNTPTNSPTNALTNSPTDMPTNAPTNAPTNVPTNAPINAPTNVPTNVPTASLIVRESCDNLPGIIKKNLTCEMLKNLEDKNKKKKLCKQEAFFKGCPALCNLRCKCKDTTSKFKIMIAGEKKKRKCKNVGKTDQPNCTDLAIGGFVQDICPKTCNFCFDV